MAYDEPSTQNTGDLITATIWNKMVNSILALRTGSIAIASQAALDHIYPSSATQLTRLAKGTALQSVRLNAAVNAYEFYTPKILQVVAATYATETSNSSSTYADTGLTASITPISTSNKVLVIVCQNGIAKAAANTSVGLKLFRDVTEIALFGLQVVRSSDTLIHVGAAAHVQLDAPASTSALTYKTKFNSNDNANAALVQQDSVVSSIALLEVGF